MFRTISFFGLGLIISVIMGCESSTYIETKLIDVQGHRGCRGLEPENTIPAFHRALELGVTTLELDVVVTADQHVVVSHEPFLSHEICSDTNGERIAAQEEKTLNIYRMSLERLQQYDCGSQPHPRFLDQQRKMVFKPTLASVIRYSDSLALALKRPLPFYNIETKSTITGDMIYHPTPDIFADLLVQVIREQKD